ncbi:MAG TPA: hypothetical protein VI278_07655 [Nitrososphaeraceae archaeon]|jgi:hypothetical protein
MNNNKNKIKSILIMVAVLSSIFVLSSALGKPVSAQTSNSKADNGINDYKDFKNCLLNAESTKGYATEKEIKTCFSPIYINSTSSGSTDTGAPPAGQ